MDLQLFLELVHQILKYERTLEQEVGRLRQHTFFELRRMHVNELFRIRDHLKDCCDDL